MQPQFTQEQPLTVPRRTLDVEDYIDILRRHRSWILGPVFIGIVIGVVSAYLWPDSYRAEGTIRVVPPQVSTRLLQTNISEEMAQRISAIQLDIMGRSVLLNLIQTHNLYPDERKRLPTEDVIEEMRNGIYIGQIQGINRGAKTGSAFSVSFSYHDKRLAQKVCSELITRFVDESTRTRSTQSLVTTEFFRDQLEMAKRELDEIDTKLTQFRQTNMGQLPEQESAIIGRMSALESTLQNVNNSMSRVNQEKLQLETSLRVMREQASAIAETPVQSGPVSVRDDRLGPLDREISQLENSLMSLRERYRDNHPDVARVETLLAQKRKQRDGVVAEIDVKRSELEKSRPGSTQARIPAELGANIARVETALKSKDMEMADLQKQLHDSRARINNLQSRLEASPAAAQEFIQLMRDRELAQQRFAAMSAKMQISSLATDLENRKQGETLEVLEQPILPAEPYAPKREFIILGGLFAGLAVGIALASGRELRDTSLKNLKDVRAYTRLTVLGSIPLLENDFVVRRRRRLAWLAWSAAFLLGVLLMTGSIVYYYTSKS